MPNRISSAWDALRGKSQPSLTQKDIWGQTWQAFMGMETDEGGVSPITDQPGDYSRAVAVESYIFRCLDVRGDALAQVPLKCWQDKKDGSRQSIDHDALAILRANNTMSPVVGTDLMRYTLGSKDLHGRACWTFATNFGGKPSELYWMVPTQYVPLPNQFGGLRAVRLITNASVKEIDASKLVYFSTANFEAPLYGTSKIKVLRNAINLRQYSARSNMDFFKNSMRPDWVLTGDWKNTEENVENIKRNLRRHFSGESNRQPLVIGEGAKAHLLTASAKDMEWLAQQRLSQEEISAVFGVPLIYLSNLDRATFENIKTAKLILWHDTMIPETKKLAEQMNQNFLWRFWPETRDAKIYLGFDYNEVEGLGEDVAQIWERFNAYMQRIDEQVTHRVLTPDQARMAMEAFANDLGVVTTPWHGKHPPGLMGDTHLLPFNNLPVEQLSVQTIIDIEAARSSNPNASALIESVPGAPNASQNADEAATRLDEQIAIQQEVAQQRAGQSSNSTQAAAPRVRLVQKRLNPIPQRDARLAPVQARLVKRLKPHFQMAKTETLRNIRAIDMLKTTKAPIDPNGALYDEAGAKARLRAIIRTGILDSANAAYSAGREDYQLSVNFTDDHAWLDQFVGQRLRYINGIDDNLRKQLRDALSESMRSGDSIPTMTDKVGAIFQDAMTWGSERIARTETLAAYGAASLQSYREANIQQAQMYDGTANDPECAAVNGQIVSLAEAAQLMASEHPNGTRGVAPVVDLGFAEDAPPIVAAAPKVTIEKHIAIVPGITLVA